MYSLTFHPTHLESSLRIRRVLSSPPRLACSSRIIPPHTEGTATIAARNVSNPNHPSPYGGYLALILFLQSEGESSLPIWRVPYAFISLPHVSRIIPPHTEGTGMLAEMDREHWNHPSAYGGYGDVRRNAVSTDESSLRIRRVLHSVVVFVLSVRIIPQHTEGTLRKINVFRWSMGNVCQYTIWFFASSHRPLLYARFVLILSCPSPFHHQICPIFSEKKKNSKKNHVFFAKQNLLASKHARKGINKNRLSEISG